MIPLSVMRTQVQRLIQMVGDSGYGAKIDDWINQRYDDIMRRYEWPQVRRTTTFVTTADSETQVLIKDVDRVLQIQDRTNDVVLQKIDPQLAAKTMVDLQDTSGIPHAYWEEEDTVAAQPTSGSTLSIASNSASDVTQTVRVWGIVNGEEDSEQVSLAGTTAQVTTRSFTRVDRVAKSDVTIGRVRVTANAGAVTVVDLGSGEYTARYTRIHLVRRPNAAITYNMTYLYKVLRLINDQDIPVIPCHTALIVGAYAQGLEEHRQFAKAQIEWAKYEGAVNNLIDRYERQGDSFTQFVPQIDQSDIDTTKRY